MQAYTVIKSVTKGYYNKAFKWRNIKFLESDDMPYKIPDNIDIIIDMQDYSFLKIFNSLTK